MSSKVVDWDRDRHWMVRRIAMRIATAEYEELRSLGFTAEQAQAHAHFILADVRGIAESSR